MKGIFNMTDSKHTPAPWVLKPDPDADNRWDMVAVSDYRYIQCEGRTYEEAQANAQLISAAPELLEALENCLPHIRSTALSNAQKAIAKAKGQ